MGTAGRPRPDAVRTDRWRAPQGRPPGFRPRWPTAAHKGAEPAARVARTRLGSAPAPQPARVERPQAGPAARPVRPLPAARVTAAVSTTRLPPPARRRARL